MPSARPLRIVVPNTAGGTTDLLARLVGGRLGEALGQPVVTDLKPGAAGRIAMDIAAKSAPDGHTLLLANNGTNAIAPAGGGGIDLGASWFAPVMRLTDVAIVIATAPALGVATLASLVDAARRAPGGLSYASGGAGSTSHVAAALLSRRAGISLLHIPYSGTALAVKDVLAGEVPLIFTQLATVAPLLRTGQLRALAVTGARRVEAFPDIPTVAESGYQPFDVTTWHGLLAPAGTPAAIVARLHEHLVRIIGNAEVREQLAALGMEAVGNTPEQFAAEIAADLAQWASLVDAGVVVPQ